MTVRAQNCACNCNNNRQMATACRAQMAVVVQ